MGFLSGGLGAIVSGGTSLLSMPLQNYYNKKAASKANDYNWSMWQATNEYNTPAAQMKRFEEAGLNKNLIYGQTNTTSPMAMTGPNAPDAQGALSKVGQSLMDYYAIKNAKASNDKLNAEIAGIKAGIENQNVKTMSDFWDLYQRINGGYGSDSNSTYKGLRAVGDLLLDVGLTLDDGVSAIIGKPDHRTIGDELRERRLHPFIRNGRLVK